MVHGTTQAHIKSKTSFYYHSEFADQVQQPLISLLSDGSKLTACVCVCVRARAHAHTSRWGGDSWYIKQDDRAEKLWFDSHNLGLNANSTPTYATPSKALSLSTSALPFVTHRR